MQLQSGKAIMLNNTVSLITLPFSRVMSIAEYSTGKPFPQPETLSVMGRLANESTHASPRGIVIPLEGYREALRMTVKPDQHNSDMLRDLEVPYSEIPMNSDRGWTTKDNSRGIGDTFTKLTFMLGIEQCGGCKYRQAVLNAMFPYSQNQ